MTFSVGPKALAEPAPDVRWPDACDAVGAGIILLSGSGSPHHVAKERLRHGACGVSRRLPRRPVLGAMRADPATALGHCGCGDTDEDRARALGIAWGREDQGGTAGREVIGPALLRRRSTARSALRSPWLVFPVLLQRDHPFFVSPL